MSRKLTESEIENIESLGHLLKYIMLKKNATGADYWKGMLALDEHGKFILENNIDDSEYDQILDLDLCKDFLSEFVEILNKDIMEKMSKIGENNDE